MLFAIIYSVINLILLSIIIFFLGKFFILAYRALRKYLSSSEQRSQKETVKRNLGEILREYRINCNMTQEFVAESLVVSRQTVSKWETGQSEPSTSNLIAISMLYGVHAEDILKQTSGKY
ncbi:MAG: helix-turn-helix transcriptional regulator [Eubacteriaceae bacterium]|nr:helix-turn-helix transcriptional regulator [Eubacteriaceae bacterium]